MVAIPARDEAERIGACLRALACSHRDHAYGAAEGVRVVVLANNCRDATADVARAFARGSAMPVDVHEIRFAPAQATAGQARRTAMDIAAAHLGEAEGVILTTDADSRVAPDWLRANLREIGAGADAVAGLIEFDPDDAPLSCAYRRVRNQELAYAGLCARLADRLDPRPHDPWPNHLWAWGASLAVRKSTYRRVGGLPPAALAEDRAFIAALQRCDAHVRYATTVKVLTSSRIRGRAPGGLADLIATHAMQAQPLCDALLEPADIVFRRAAWRGRLRRAHGAGRLDDALHSASLGLAAEPAGVIADLARGGSVGFGELWTRIEAASPRLGPVRMRLSDLPRETVRLGRRIRMLDPSGPAMQRLEPV